MTISLRVRLAIAAAFASVWAATIVVSWATMVGATSSGSSIGGAPFGSQGRTRMVRSPSCVAIGISPCSKR